MKKILITGVAGMIGSNLLEYKLNLKCKIYGIDNFSNGYKKNIKLFLKNKNFKFFKKDLSKVNVKDNFLSNFSEVIFDEIWLLSANSDINHGNKDYLVDTKDTLVSVVNTIKIFKKNISKKTKIIFTSSSAIYGYQKNKISEKIINFDPESNYGCMKLACENFLFFARKRINFKLYIFRLPNVVGKNLTHGILFDFKKKIQNNYKKYLKVLGNGYQKKPYISCNYLIKIIHNVLKKNIKNNVNIFNIGPDDNGIYVKDIAKLFLKYTQTNKKIVFEKKKTGWLGDVVYYSYNNRKLKKIIQNYAETSSNAIKDAIKEMNDY